VFITRLSSRLLQDDRLSASPAVGGKQEIEQFKSMLIIAIINDKCLFLSCLVADFLLLGQSCEK